MRPSPLSTALLLGLPGLLLPTPSALAEDKTLPTVHVHATQVEELDADSPRNPYRVAPSSRPSVQVLTAEDIAAFQPRDVFDLLSHAVGGFPMYQGRKVPVHMQFRGDTQFAYIIDGAYLERDTGARMLANLPLSAIEQVEVVRDATALTLGPMVNFSSPSGAPNDGFIVVRTRRPLDREGLIRLGAESFGTASLEAGGGTVSEDGYLSGLARSYTTDGPADAHAARDNTTALLRGGFRRQALAVDLLAYHDRGRSQFQRAEAGTSTTALVDMRWSFDPIQTRLVSANARYTWSPEHTSLATLYHNELTATFRQGQFSNDTVTTRDNTDRSSGAAFRHSFRRDGLLLTGGGQYVHWETPTGQLFYEGKRRDEEILGGFLQAEQGLLGGALVIDGAYRQDQKKVRYGVDSYGHFTSYPNSIIRNRTMPVARFLSLGMSWKASADWLLTARYAHGEQDAGIGVMTDPGVRLGTETQDKFEASVRYSGWRDVTARLTAFHQEVDNFKSPIRFDAITQQAVYGQSDARRNGLELQFNGRLGEGTHWHLSWTHMTSDDMVDDHGRSPPRNLGTAELTRRQGAWTLTGSIQRVGPYTSNFFSPGGAEAGIGNFTRVDVVASRPIRLGRHGAHLSLYSRNLTNRHYQTQLGYPDAGAVWGTALQIDL